MQWRCKHSFHFVMSLFFQIFGFHSVDLSNCRCFRGAKVPPIRWNRNTRTYAMPKWTLCSIKIVPIWKSARCTWHCFRATNAPKWSFNRASGKLFICPISMRTSPKWLHRRKCWMRPAFNTHNTYRRARKSLSILPKSIVRKTSISCRPRQSKKRLRKNDQEKHSHHSA